MKKIITAIGNSLINEYLKNTNKYIIQTPDIQYKEDLIEVLKNKTDTEILILSSEIIKEEKIIDYIKEIKQINKFIKIIILLENKNDEMQNLLLVNGIKNIFYGNEIPIEELEEAINKNKTTEEILVEEINNLKEIILKEKTNKIKNIKEINLSKFKIINRK